MYSSLFSLSKGMRRIAVGSHNLFTGTVRFFSSKKSSRMNLYSIIRPIGNPRISIVPELDRWVDTGKNVQVPELLHIIRDLRKRRRFSQALEVLWIDPCFSLSLSLPITAFFFRNHVRDLRFRVGSMSTGISVIGQ